MVTVSSFALRLPPALMDDVKRLAMQDAVSVNQFLVQVAAERGAVLEARAYLAERSVRAVAGDLGRVVARAGTPTAIAGDELPGGGGTRGRFNGGKQAAAGGARGAALR